MVIKEGEGKRRIFQVLLGGGEQFFWGPRGGGRGFLKAQMESPELVFSISIAWSLRGLGERNTECFKSDRERTSQVNNSSSKEENINDKVKNTSGHHYPIDDIDTKILIAPKNSNDEFKQVYVQNNKKKL